MRESGTFQRPLLTKPASTAKGRRHVQEAASWPRAQLTMASRGPEVPVGKALGACTSQLALLRLPTAESGLPGKQDRQGVCTYLETVHSKGPAHATTGPGRCDVCRAGDPGKSRRGIPSPEVVWGQNAVSLQAPQSCLLRPSTDSTQPTQTTAADLLHSAN